jgi:hypothetical protein
MGSASAVNTSKPALNNDFFMALMRDDRARYIEEITVIALFRWKGKHSNLIKLLLNIYLPNFLIIIFEKLNFRFTLIIMNLQTQADRFIGADDNLNWRTDFRVTSECPTNGLATARSALRPQAGVRKSFCVTSLSGLGLFGPGRAPAFGCHILAGIQRTTTGVIACLALVQRAVAASTARHVVFDFHHVHLGGVVHIVKCHGLGIAFFDHWKIHGRR